MHQRGGEPLTYARSARAAAFALVMGAGWLACSRAPLRLDNEGEGDGGAGDGGSIGSSGGAGAGPAGECSSDGFSCAIPDDCCTGECTLGQCGPPVCRPGEGPVVLADGLEWPLGIALYGPHVYFTDYSPKGGVFRVVREGGAPDRLASMSYPEQLEVDRDGVFVTATDDGTIVRLPLTGGPADVLASGQQGPTDLALDATHVYWTSHLGDGVRRALRSGSGVETLATADGPYRLALTASRVYFGAGPGGPYRVGKQGGTVETVSAAGASRTLAVDGSFVVWTDTLGPSIGAFDEATGVTSTVVQLPLGEFPDGIALDDAFVYYTLASGSVWRVPRAGGLATLVAADQGAFPTLVAADATCVYWTSVGAEGAGSAGGRVLRAPKN